MGAALSPEEEATRARLHELNSQLSTPPLYNVSLHYYEPFSMLLAMILAHVHVFLSSFASVSEVFDVNWFM